MTNPQPGSIITGKDLHTLPNCAIATTNRTEQMRDFFTGDAITYIDAVVLFICINEEGGVRLKFGDPGEPESEWVNYSEFDENHPWQLVTLNGWDKIDPHQLGNNEDEE